jgi:quinol monooxygenase YgiN
MDRREFIVVAGASVVGAAGRSSSTQPVRSHDMFGLIGKMSATPGQRDALLEILLAGTATMPGCLSYIIAKDSKDPDAIWITEVWDSKASHDASLALPAVKAAIAKARPIIAGFGDGATTVPVGGVGLPKPRD